MEYNNGKDNKNEEKIRRDIIKEILTRFNVFKDLEKNNEEDNISNYEKKNELGIGDINDYFKDLKPNEIAYILYLFSLSDERKVENMINIFDTLNSILSHYEYYKKKNPKIKYNNSHFDNYLLKRYDCSYIFTTYLSEKECRELKIDNKLFFNYIPVKCLKVHKSEDPKSKINCEFAHNEFELKFHPFVYKKFKCKNKNCKKDCDCYNYHANNDGDSSDMETEVDFDSNEIAELKQIILFIFSGKNDKDNYKEKTSKPKEKSDFIPTEFNPATYKMYRCPLGIICKLDVKLCLNYHSKNDKRRNPDLYEPELCPNLYKNNKTIKNGKCDLGDDCNKAHNFYEYFYHPKKFRKKECPVEKKDKLCYNRLICPYYHESDSVCGEDDEKMMLDQELISNYYKSLMVLYEKSIDSELSKLKEIKKRYVCYKCGQDNALDHKSFFVDINEKKIICEECKNKYKNRKFKEIEW